MGMQITFGSCSVTGKRFVTALAQYSETIHGIDVPYCQIEMYTIAWNVAPFIVEWWFFYAIDIPKIALLSLNRPWIYQNSTSNKYYDSLGDIIQI